MAVADPVPVIQATLAPVFLVSGGSIFLNFLQARLFRINDRLRQLAHDIDGTPAGSERRMVMKRNIVALARRQRLIRNAIVLGVMTVLLTMLTTVLLIAPAFAPVAVPGQLTVTVFTIGLVTFAVALGLALRDTLLSVQMVEAEIVR